MKKTYAVGIFVFFTGTVFGVSFEDIAKQLLGPGERATLKGQSVAIVAASDPVSADFSVAFENVLKKDATIVQNDHSITQREIDRQESGLVDEKQVARYGKEKGAETVIQLMLTRVAGTSKVKVQMKGVSVEGNYLVVSGVVTAALPGSYNIALLPVPKGESAAQVKNMTNKIVDAKVKAIYDEPYKPPKPPRKPIEFPKIELPKIDLSGLTDGAWWGVYPNVTEWRGNSGTLTGLRISLEYGHEIAYRDGEGLCLELSAMAISELSAMDIMDTNTTIDDISISAWGYDINAGYGWWWSDYGWIPASFIVSGGFAYIPNDIFSEYIPYIQLKLQFFIGAVALRISPVDPFLALSYGLTIQFEF